MHEAALAELLDDMQHSWLFAGGLLTYPDGSPTDQSLYAMCRELECRGVLRRVCQKTRADTAVVLFVARDEQKTDAYRDIAKDCRLSLSAAQSRATRGDASRTIDRLRKGRGG